MAKELVTERLLLRPWTTDDATAALGSYGDQQVARWLVPAMDRVPDEAAMRLVLQQWIAEDARTTPPAGRWAVELREDRSLIGGATLLPLPPDDEYEVGWQLRPHAWGHGYATEIGRELARWAFEQGISRSLRSYGRRTREPSRWSAAWAWSGSGKPTSTTACACRCIACARPISRRPRIRCSSH